MKYLALNALRHTPNDICRTPNITDIFILSEFIYVNSFLDKYHMGSTPTGYKQSSYNGFPVSGS